MSGGSTIKDAERGAGLRRGAPPGAGQTPRHPHAAPANHQNNSGIRAEASVAVRDGPSGAVVSVFAKPRASKTRVLGAENGVLAVAIAAPPVDGAANEELVRALADYFDIPRRRVTIVGGDASRHKKVELAGLSAADVLAKVTSGR